MYLRWYRNINGLYSRLKHNRLPCLGCFERAGDAGTVALGLPTSRERMGLLEAGQAPLFFELVRDLTGQETLLLSQSLWTRITE